MRKTTRTNQDDDARCHQQVLQPALCSLLPQSVVEKTLMPFITHKFTSKRKLIQAVDAYVANPSVFCYPIGLWDVSEITDFSHVFDAKRNPRLEHFNEDLSRWDVSNGTNFSQMFNGCSSFNGDVSSWDVSNARNMRRMFNGCRSFNGDISSWNVSKATNMSLMFDGCMLFNCDVSSWDVHNVTDFCAMFDGCASFKGDVSSWDVSNAADVRWMFAGYNRSFHRDNVRSWGLSDETKSTMFC